MKLLNLSLIVFLFFGNFVAAQETAPALKVEGFSHPESVVFDADKNLIYVSNIGNREPGDGFISKLSGAGEVLELKWITGLNDPKGLLVKGDKLFVTDNTEVVEMDPETGKILRKDQVQGAQFLNDIAVDNQGNLLISDTGKGSIYVRDDSGNYREWLNAPGLEKPNGVLPVGDKIYVAAWGDGKPGNLLEVDRRTQEIKKISKEGIGNLDGIQQIDKNSFYISDWATGKVHRVDRRGDQREIFTSAKSAGDILFLKDKNKIFVPMNHQNEVWVYDVQ